MKRSVIVVFVLIAGLAGFTWYQQGTDHHHAVAPETDSTEPLYWVAPMDPNYRRDAPGKSPMGMDLVPVYAGQDEGKGLVRITAAVEHNIGVRTVTARTGRLQDRLSTVAYVRYDETDIWHAYPRVDGWIDRLYVDTEGEEVMPGDPLYDIYSPTLVSAQDEYLSALRSGNPALISSSEERLRALEVPDELVRALKQTGKVQQTVTVPAPQGGVISKLGVREGHYVTPGTEILEIAGLENVWLTTEVFARDAGQVEVGSRLQVRFDGMPDGFREAEINFVSPVLDADSRTLEVRASLPNQAGLLRPNMFAEASLILSADADAVLVPRDALIRTGMQNRVVVKTGDGTFKSVAVKTGRIGTSDVEIQEGLLPGDEVVSSAQFLIDSESSITSDFRRMDLDRSDRSGMGHGSMDGGQIDHSTMDHGQADHGAMDHSTMDHGQADHSAVDHNTMDHGQADHSAMDHSTMDHSQMDHGAMDHSTRVHAAAGESVGEVESRGVWVMGSIRSVDQDARTVVLRHEPIPAWNWPGMTMTMDLGSELDPASLIPGAGYHLLLQEQQAAPTGYLLVDAKPLDTPR
ncbi:MAG: efflux RND transporter periplasmic adaptor subunit [Pseudomonadota bacterium]